MRHRSPPVKLVATLAKRWNKLPRGRGLHPEAMNGIDCVYPDSESTEYLLKKQAFR